MATTSPATVSGFSQYRSCNRWSAASLLVQSEQPSQSYSNDYFSTTNFNPRLRQLSELGDRYFRVAVRSNTENERLQTVRLLIRMMAVDYDVVGCWRRSAGRYAAVAAATGSHGCPRGTPREKGQQSSICA